MHLTSTSATRRIPAVAAALLLGGITVLAGGGSAGAEDYASSCDSVLLPPGSAFDAPITVVGTAPASIEAGAPGELTDVTVTYSAPGLEAPPGAVLLDGTVVLTNGITVDLGDSAPTEDGATWTFTAASTAFTAGPTPGPMEFAPASVSYVLDLFPVTCTIADGAAFASATVIAGATTTTSSGGTTTTLDGGATTSTTPVGGAGELGGASPSPATPVAGRPGYTG